MIWTSRIAEFKNLEKAWRMVKASGGGAGIDGITIENFENQSTARLEAIAQKLKRDRYRFSRLRPAFIPKNDGTQRRLSIPTIDDRIVLQSIRLVIEPICEPHFHDCSHAYRPGRGTFTAMEQVAQGLQSGLHYVLESDIRQFFDSIRHKNLLQLLAAIDPKLIKTPSLVSSLNISCGWRGATKGVAQGSPLSPLLANVALIEFDREMVQSGLRIIRYADDFLVLCDSAAGCEFAQQHASKNLAKAGLELHPGKTQIVDSRSSSFSFLGFEIHPDRIIPSQNNLADLRSGLAAWCNPHLEIGWLERIERINGLLRSFAWYYHQTDSRRLFWSLDELVLEQLESIEGQVANVSTGWRGRLLRISEMRNVSWRGQTKGKDKKQSWNGYGR
jgi:group II intron reverse transcriptase/maturase